MDVEEEWMQWEDEKTLNRDKEGGLHPAMERDHGVLLYTKLFYCYYTPTKEDNSTAASENGLHVLIVAAYVVGATVGFVLIIAIILTAIQRALLLHQAERSCPESGSRHRSTDGRSHGPARSNLADGPPPYDVVFLDSPHGDQRSSAVGRSSHEARLASPQMLTTDDVIRPPSYDDVLRENNSDK